MVETFACTVGQVLMSESQGGENETRRCVCLCMWWWWWWKVVVVIDGSYSRLYSPGKTDGGRRGEGRLREGPVIKFVVVTRRLNETYIWK